MNLACIHIEIPIIGLLKQIFSSSPHHPNFQNVNLRSLFEDVGQSFLMGPEIFCTIRGGSKESLEEMIGEGEIFPYLIDSQENSVLHIVVTRDHLHIVELIVSSYPNLIKKLNLNGETVFHVAASAGHLAVVKYLADFIIRDSLDEGERLMNEISLVRNNNGDTALHVALKSNHVEVASCLLGGNPHALFIANVDEKSPLDLAVEVGCMKLVKEMLESSSIDHAESSTSSSASWLKGDYILHTAIKARRIDILDVILGKDQNLIKLKYKEGRTCLSFAAKIGFYEGVSYLLEKSASHVYVEDDDGLFPIHLAAKGGHVLILWKFYRRFPNSKELLTREGKNILHIAAENGRASAFVFICVQDKKQKMINEQDVNGNTPFHLAKIHRRANIVTTFVCLGIGNLHLKNNAGQTAMDIAKTNLQSNYVINERVILVALTFAQTPLFVPLVNRSASTTTDGNAYIESVNTLLVVATLLATVSFATAFTIPGGYNSSGPDIGMATLAKKTTFKVFIICNTVAMGASVPAVVALLWARLGDTNSITKFVEIALNYLVVALLAMPIGFTAGMVLVVSHIPHLRLAILILALLLFCPIPFLLLPFCLQYLIFFGIYLPYQYQLHYLQCLRTHPLTSVFFIIPEALRSIRIRR